MSRIRLQSTVESDAQACLRKLSVQARAGDKKAMIKARDLAVELALQQVATGERSFSNGDRHALRYLLWRHAHVQAAASAARARGVRSDNIEALVDEVLASCREAFESKGSRFRTGFLVLRIKQHVERHNANLPPGTKPLTVPEDETVRKILREWGLVNQKRP